MTIPLASPLAQYQAHKAEIDAAIARVLESGNYILGHEVEDFEAAFADYCGTAHAIGVASGTDALILALRALNIGAGDQVITVSHTAVATVAAILAIGATPVLIDIDPIFYTMNPELIEAAITPRTKAIIPVHLYGHPADMDAITAIANKHGIVVIEDCAQAAGARWGNRRIGSTLGCFSFYPTKNLGAIGDGGMITTNDAALDGRIRRLRQYGWNNIRDTQEPGLNSRLDPLQAAILMAKLPFLDDDNKRRGEIAQKYDAAFAHLPLWLPAVHPNATHVYHLYVVFCQDRDSLISHMAEQNIGAAVHYPVPVHRQQGYAKRVSFNKLLITRCITDHVLSLPMYPELDDNSINRVIEAVRGFFSISHMPAAVA